VTMAPRFDRGSGRRVRLNGRGHGDVEPTGPTAGDDRLKDELRQARERLALLDDAGLRIGTTLDCDRTCAELADFLVPLLAEVAVVELLPAESVRGRTLAVPGVQRLRRTAVAIGPEQPDRSPRREQPAVGQECKYEPESAVVRCLLSGEPVLRQPLPAEGLHPPSPGTPPADHGGPPDGRTVLTVPLCAREQVLGVLTLERTGEAGFTEHEIAMARDVARRAAPDIDSALRYARSQNVTLELQRALLTEPGSPHPSLELASRYLPSGSSAVVGGDWFETVRLSYGRTLLVIGDVMGHGVEAAVDMSNYRAMLRYVAGTDLPPHRILRQVDDLIAQAGTARPATCLLVLVDPTRGRATYAGAGHLPPALFGADGGVELIEVPTGPPLGTGFGGYESVTRELRPDQVLLLYTDGLVERRGEDIDCSLDRVTRLRLPVTGPLDDLLDLVLSGLVPQSAEDDIAVVAARVRSRPPGAALTAAPRAQNPAPAQGPPPAPERR